MGYWIFRVSITSFRRFEKAIHVINTCRTEAWSWSRTFRASTSGRRRCRSTWPSCPGCIGPTVECSLRPETCTNIGHLTFHFKKFQYKNYRFSQPKHFKYKKKNHRNFHPKQLHILFDIPIKKLPHSHLDEKWMLKAAFNDFIVFR